MDALNATYSTAAMRRLWADDAILAAMLRFEAELAAAQAECSLIPSAAAQAIGTACTELRPDALAIGTEAQRSGTLAIPLVKQLKAAVAERRPEAAHLVHLGATSQDIADTALVLTAMASLDLLLADLRVLGDALAALVREHDETPILARTLLQPAAPVSFGWKAAGWLDAVARCAAAVQRQRQEAGVLQLGGANGTLLLHGSQGTEVLRALARRLGLAVPDITWHGARDRLARLAAELAILCGMLGKFGRDISLLMQAEVGEAFEPSGEGRGGSSAMPHKRNPVASMHMLDAAYRAPALAQMLAGELAAEHERGLGSWPNALPVFDTLFGLCANALAAAAETAGGLRVDAEAMRRNLDQMHGVVFSERLNSVVAEAIGPARAAKAVAAASATAMQSARHVVDVLAESPELAGQVDRAALERACAMECNLDGARPMIERVLARWQSLAPSLPA
ncbi:MAG: lyase family protein [Pigmentiphaga sp.]